MSLIQAALANIEIVILIFVIATIITVFIPSRIKLVINGALLFGLAALHYLQDTALIYSQIAASEIVPIVIAYVVGATATGMISESLKEKSKIMEGFSMISGFFLLGIIIIPQLYNYGAIDFNIPEFSEYAQAILFAVAGLIAILTAIFEEPSK